ncbi:MAG: glycosyltransferase, partial [bacterium]
RYKEATLVVAPRHLERAPEIETLVKKMKFQYVLKSKLAQQATSDERRATIILDTLGELNAFYKLSDLSFVGGTIAPFGGHNILEPAAFKKPVLFGPFVNNVKEIAEDMGKDGGGRKIYNAEDMGQAFNEILSDENKRTLMGERAYNVFLKHKQSANKQAEIIKKYVS